MKSSWRPLSLSTYSATSRALISSAGGMTDIRGLSDLNNLRDNIGPINRNSDSNSFGEALLSGRPTYTAYQNLTQTLSSRVKPDAHMLHEAQRAIDRLENRKDENVEAWAQELANSSMEVD